MAINKASFLKSIKEKIGGAGKTLSDYTQSYQTKLMTSKMQDKAAEKYAKRMTPSSKIAGAELKIKYKKMMKDGKWDELRKELKYAKHKKNK